MEFLFMQKVIIRTGFYAGFPGIVSSYDEGTSSPGQPVTMPSYRIIISYKNPADLNWYNKEVSVKESEMEPT